MTAPAVDLFHTTPRARLQSLYAAVIRAQRRAERYPHSRVDTTGLTRALEAFSSAAAEALNLEEP